jgi:hypothetical protein
MKKLALISTHCDKQEKIEILKNNIIKLKNKGLDILIYTSISLPQHVIEVCDFVIFSKENPVLNWPEKAFWGWRSYQVNNEIIQLNTTLPDHGFACLNQFKKMSILALSMNYDYYYSLIYDLKINDIVYDLIDDNLKNSFFPSKRENNFWNVGLHFFSLDSHHLNNFINIINKESYLKNTDLDAFSWLETKITEINCKIENQIVEELYTLENEHNPYNQSHFDSLCFFIQKDGEKEIKIVFYNNPHDNLNIKIKTEFFEKEFVISNWDIINLGYVEIETLIITYNEIEIDHSDVLNKTINNSIEIFKN